MDRLLAWLEIMDRLMGMEIPLWSRDCDWLILDCSYVLSIEINKGVENTRKY